MSSAAIIVPLDPEEYVLLDLGEIVPRPGCDGLSRRLRSQLRLDEGQLIPAGWADAGESRRIPNISSLARVRARLGAAPLHMLFNQVAGRWASTAQRGCSVAGCG